MVEFCSTSASSHALPHRQCPARTTGSSQVAHSGKARSEPIVTTMTTTQSPSASAQPELQRPGGGSVRALVVDDESTLAELLSMALRYESWDVRTAGDGLTALRIAREFK